MRHHLSNDSTKKTEVVKQSICHGGVFFAVYSSRFYREDVFPGEV